MSFKYAGRDYSFDFLGDDDLLTSYIQTDKTFYEIDLLEYLARVVRKDGTVIDVGAHIGNHSVFFGGYIGKSVICVEPNPEAFAALAKNTSRHPGNYTLIAGGLGEQEAFGELRLPDPRNTGSMKIKEGAGDIMVTTLDRIAPPDVSLVKIDVEGMELAVLRGGIDLLKAQHPDLVIEAGTPEAFTEHCAFLKPLGYLPISRWARTPTWHYAWKPSVGLLIKGRALMLRNLTLRFAKRALRGVKNRLSIQG